MIAPGDRHDFESLFGARCLVLDSTDPAWAALHTRAPRAEALPLAQYLATACVAGRPRAGQFGPALLLEAWGPANAPLRSRRPIDWMALQRWATQRAAQPLSVADLAARTHLSTAHFTERCQLELGTSPMAWLRDLRLDRARQLRSQGLPVSEVALRCGYRSPSALTAALRRAEAAPAANGDD